MFTYHKWLLLMIGGVVLMALFFILVTQPSVPLSVLDSWTIRGEKTGYYTYGKACRADAECVCAGNPGAFDECGKPGQFPGCVNGTCGFKTDIFFSQQAVTTTDNWKQYRNDEYGFGLTLSEGYETVTARETPLDEEGIRGIHFEVDAKDTYWPDERFGVFGVYIYPLAWWKENIRLDSEGDVYFKDEPEGLSLGGYLGQNAKYAFVWNRGQDCPGSKTDTSNFGANTVQCKLFEDSENVVKTFYAFEPLYADWQTYRNDEYGFEFSYPPHLKEYTIQIDSNQIFRRGWNPRRNGENIVSTLYKAPLDVLEINKIAESEIIETQLDTERAYRYKQYGDGPCMSDNIRTSLKGHTLEFSFAGCPLLLEAATIDRILSTFKFAENSDRELGADLLTIVWSGGLCPSPDGQGQTCTSVFTLRNDGTYTIDNNSGTISAADVRTLSGLISVMDFDTLKSKKFTGECPRSYDGFAPTYTFYLEARQEIIDSCEVAIDQKSPLFSAIDSMLRKASPTLNL